MKIRYFLKRELWWIDFRDSAGKRHRAPTGVSDEAEARRLAPSIVARVLAVPPEGVSVRPQMATVANHLESGHTLESAFKLAKRSREKWMQAKDKKGLEIKFEACAEYWGASRDLAHLTHARVLKWREHMMKEEGMREGSTLSSSTINHRLSFANVLLELVILPPHGVKHLSVKGNRRKRRARESELRAVISWLHSSDRSQADAFADLIEVGLATTARQGELLALKKADIYLDRRVVCFRDTKGNEAREVPLTDAALAIVEKRLKAGLAGPFTGLKKGQCTVLWAAARKAIGLEDDAEFVFHVGTRHEGLSRMAEQGASSFIIKAMAGHKNIATSDGYVKPGVESLRDYAEAAGKNTKRV